MRKISKGSAVGAVVWLYQQLSTKGVFALMRVTPSQTGVKFQSHVDFDKPEYEEVVKSAKSSKTKEK